MVIIEDPFENIDDLLNFSCGDFEGDDVQGESISDIFSRCNDIPTEFYLPYEGSAHLEHLSTFFEDSCFLGSVAVDKGSSVKNNKNKQNCDSGHFQTPSPVSVLDSRSSLQVVKTMPIKRPRTATFIHRPIISLMPPTSLSNDLVLPFPSEYKTTLRRPNSVATESMKRKKVIMSPMPDSFEQSVSQQTHSVQKCLHCQTRKTPQERMGPLGPKTLCNVYGVRYKLGQMVLENQPTAIPTCHGTSLNKNNDSCNFQTPSSVSFHDSNGSRSDVETTSIKPEIAVLGKTHSKRPRTAAFSSPPVLPPVAVEAKKRKKVKLLTVSGPLEHCDTKRTKSVPKCLCCETKKMPKGRVGPLRPRTLRNAYGVRYKLGRLFAESPRARPKTICNIRGVPYNLGRLLPEHQPSASPTFEDSVNTNKNNDSNHFQMLSSVVFLSSSSSSCSEVETMPINPETVSPGNPHSELPCTGTSIAQPVIQLMSHTLSTDPVPTLPSFQSFSKELERLSEFVTTNIKVTENFISPPVIPLVSPTSSPDQLQPFPSEVFSKGMENLSGCGTTNSKAHTEIPCTETFISPPVIPLTSPTSSTNQVTQFPSELYSIEIEKISEVRTAQNIPGPVATELELKKRKNVELSPKPHSIKQSPSKETKPVRKCSHCEIMATPQWRTGPLGPKTLCNACGFRYKMGSLFPEYRPSASPTFVKTLHSNKNRTVLEIRSKSDQDMAKFWSNYT